jgi:GH24 family phage-related lysozyme (muramidase)
MLLRDVQEKISLFAASYPHWNELPAHRKAAIADLSYNEGYTCGDGDHDSLDKALLAKDWDAVPKLLLQYRDPGTNTELGELRRRFAEGLIWNGYIAIVAYDSVWIDCENWEINQFLSSAL